jgi:hypothetical protein
MGVINSLSDGEKNYYSTTFNKENGKEVLLKLYERLSNVNFEKEYDYYEGFKYDNSMRKILITLLNMEKGFVCSSELVELVSDIFNFIDGETKHIKRCREYGEKEKDDYYIEKAKEAQKECNEEKESLRRALEGLLDGKKYILFKKK